MRVKFDPAEGLEQAGERPALVLSPSVVNDHSPVILVAAITSRKTERVYPFDVIVQPPEGGLSIRSKVMLLHTRGIDKVRITGHYGALGSETMQRVDQAVMVVAGLAGL